MPLDFDIKLELCCKQSFPADIITTAIQCINDAYYLSEIDDLTQIQGEFTDLPKVAFEAAVSRMKKCKKSSVLISSVEKGSIEITIAATALAYWILNQTLGETLKETWNESDMKKKVKEILGKGLDKKVGDVRKNVLRRLKQKLPVDTGISGKEPSQNNNGDKTVIEIRVELEIEKTKYPPKRGDMFGE